MAQSHWTNSWNGMKTGWNVQFAYYDTTKFEVSALWLQTVCTTLTQSLEWKDGMFYVVRGPFLSPPFLIGLYPSYYRLSSFPVSFGPFLARSRPFLFSSHYDMSVHTSSRSVLHFPFALRSQAVFNVIKTGFWMCCNPICYKYDHVLTRFYFDWGTLWVNRKWEDPRGRKGNVEEPIPHPACSNSPHSP